jgi:hypothetical protein
MTADAYAQDSAARDVCIAAIEFIGKRYFSRVGFGRLVRLRRHIRRDIGWRIIAMSAKHRLVSPLAALVLSGLPTATGAAATETQLAERPFDTASGVASPPSKPWPAPVGHRQPRAADIRVRPPRTASDEWLQRLHRELDRKLQICRGC